MSRDKHTDPPGGLRIVDLGQAQEEISPGLRRRPLLLMACVYDLLEECAEIEGVSLERFIFNACKDAVQTLPVVEAMAVVETWLDAVEGAEE